MRETGFRPAATAGQEFEGSWLRQALVGVVALKIAVIVLAFDPLGVDAFPLIKSVLSRGFAWLLLALVGLAVLRYGRAIFPPTRIHAFVLLFAAAYVVSALSAENPYVAVFGDGEKYLGLTFVADMLVLYGAVAIGFRRAFDWVILAAAIAVAGLISLAYAAVQAAGLDPFRWNTVADRPFGTFGHADILGQFLSLIFGGALGFLASSTGRRSLLTRVIAGCAVVLALVAATSAGTRGSLIGFAAALAFVPFVRGKIRPSESLTRRRVGGAALLALTLVTVIVAFTPLAARVRETIQGEHVLDRVLIYETAIRAVVDRPVTGWGPDSFAVAYPRYRQENSTTILGVGPATSAHSWPLQTAATLGLVGLVALLALLAASARVLWTQGLRRAPLVAAPVLLASAGYFAHGLIAIDAITVDWWPWVAVGTAAALSGPRLVVAPRARLGHPAAAVAFAGVALLAALSGIGALRSNHEALTAKLEWQQGHGEGSLAAAVAAVRDDPGRADHWNSLGLALELTARWRAAAEAFTEAAARAPHEAAYWSNLARARAREALSGEDDDGGAEAALAAARRAVATDPNAPEANAVLGEVANLFGDYELALDAAMRAKHLFRYEAAYDIIAAEAALNVADPGVAREKIETLIALRDSATLRVAAATLSMLLNDRETAHLHAVRALQLDPQNQTARAILNETGG